LASGAALHNTTLTTKKRFSELFYNAVTYLGLLISILVVTLEVFLFALDFFSAGGNVYLGLITYLILPGFLFFGLALVPVGYYWKKRRLRRGLPRHELKPFRIDLALSSHRNALLVFIVGTSLLVLLSIVGSYQAYHYTESVAFCGTLCHEVMHPEYTAYSHSPHARVKCVDCHIGSGAGWYVKSKASGLRQVYRTLMNSYVRPIATPVHDLRPAEETCKQCHWPGKFFGSIDFKRAYFLTKGENKRWNMRMLLNVGGGDHQTYGVHAHMNVDQTIYYAAEDERRQELSWVKSVDKQGRETVYVSEKSKWKESSPAAGQLREMDCIDCHNRPTHQFKPPYRLLNEAMQYGGIDPEIPGIKKKALAVLSKEYTSAEEADKTIRQSLREFYQQKHADYLASNSDKVERAEETIAGLYSENIFPEMKARWEAFPDNIGHMVSPGCFRCHDGEHRSPDGHVISKDCRACHVIVEQGPAGAEEKNITGLDYRHPDGTDDWKDMSCTDCHTGGAEYP
jgi:nitrate/TMAO reductase-like tetraheme cytochrome c subunit